MFDCILRSLLRIREELASWLALAGACHGISVSVVSIAYVKTFMSVSICY